MKKRMYPTVKRLPNFAEYMFDSTMEYMNVLQDIINDLPNQGEIKESRKYRKAFLEYNNTLGSYLRMELDMLKARINRERAIQK